MKTTLNLIRENSPCSSGWAKLLTRLGKTKADDEPVSILQILDSNGLNDALWCLRAVPDRDKEIRLYMVWCARQVQHLMTDPRSLYALDVAERYADGVATQDELDSAASSAYSAARSAYSAARTAESAAWAAAYSARSAYSAARTAESAAWAAAVYSTYSAARTAQEHRLRELCASCMISDSIKLKN